MGWMNLYSYLQSVKWPSQHILPPLNPRSFKTTFPTCFLILSLSLPWCLVRLTIIYFKWFWAVCISSVVSYLERPTRSSPGCHIPPWTVWFWKHISPRFGAMIWKALGQWKTQKDAASVSLLVCAFNNPFAWHLSSEALKVRHRSN